MVRFYEEKYPDIDQAVMVEVRQIKEMGAYVKLLEYDNIEGLILLSELSRRRIRSVNKLIREGRNEVVVVMKVDPNMGYVDLSKRRVSAEEVAACEEKFEKGKAVESIIIQVAKKRNVEPEELYDSIVFPLAKQYGHAFDAFKLSISEPEIVFGTIKIDAATLSDLRAIIARRLTAKPVKIRADLEVKCFAYQGIEAIKKALKAGEEASTNEVPISIRVVAAPLYVMTTTSTDKVVALQIMDKAVEAVQQTIVQQGGDINIKMKPQIVSETDDAELKDLMDRFARANTDVAGDDDSEEDDEE